MLYKSINIWALDYLPNIHHLISNMQQEDMLAQNLDQHIPIRKTLTFEELEIAVNYLKKRFPSCSIQHIVESMNNYHEFRKQRLHLPHNYYQQNQNNSLTHPPEREAPLSNICIQPAAPKESQESKKIREKEDLKLISTLFCERGNDFSYTKNYLPELTPTTYKNKLVSIMGSVVKELLALIKKQCKTKPTELTQNQLFTIKSALISAHEWMAVKSPAALQTFFNFITRINVKRHKLITKEEAVQLYNVIAGRVNDKSLDLLFLEPEDEFGNEIEKKVRPCQKQARSFSSESQVRELIAKTFLQYCNFEKVSNYLLSKYGLDVRFELQNIYASVRQIIEASFHKLNSSKTRPTILCSQMLVSKIFEEANRSILYALVQVFLRQTDDKHFFRKLMVQLQRLQNTQKSIPQKQHFEDEHESQSEVQLHLDETVQRHEQSGEELANETNCQNRYDTDCIFEEMFQVLLPKQAKSKSERRSTASSKRDQLNYSILYFDE